MCALACDCMRWFIETAGQSSASTVVGTDQLRTSKTPSAASLAVTAAVGAGSATKIKQPPLQGFCLLQLLCRFCFSY